MQRWTGLVASTFVVAAFAVAFASGGSSVGFCWGGDTSFAHAFHAPNLDAVVVYHGSTPRDADFSAIRAPVLGPYGGDDHRVGGCNRDGQYGRLASDDRVFPEASRIVAPMPRNPFTHS